jgi:hypothetical protein
MRLYRIAVELLALVPLDERYDDIADAVSRLILATESKEGYLSAIESRLYQHFDVIADWFPCERKVIDVCMYARMLYVELERNHRNVDDPQTQRRRIVAFAKEFDRYNALQLLKPHICAIMRAHSARMPVYGDGANTPAASPVGVELD